MHKNEKNNKKYAEDSKMVSTGGLREMKVTFMTLFERICGTCENYDDCFCDKHPEYGELVEKDTCKDWEEDEG